MHKTENQTIREYKLLVLLAKELSSNYLHYNATDFKGINSRGRTRNDQLSIFI